MAVASVKDPLRKFKFRVSISGGGYSFARLGFNKVGGLVMEYDDTRYREGGNNLSSRSLPGLLNWEDITLERGAIEDDFDFWESFTLAADGNPNFRFNVIITTMDPITDVPKRSHLVRRAWMKKYEQEELDASSSDVLIERISLAHEGFTLV